MSVTVTFKMIDDQPDDQPGDLWQDESLHVSRIARQLALAHHIQRLVDEGKLQGYAHAARLLKITRARMAQVMDLLLLSPEIQARILLGKLDIPERQLRPILRTPIWKDQESLTKRKLR